MITLNHQQRINTLYIAALATVVLAPDLVLEISEELLHHALESCHVLFECIESTLDHLIEHLFETDLRSTQIIVFYIMVAMAATIAYFVWRGLRNLYLKLTCAIKNTWLVGKNRLGEFWNHQSLFGKVKLFSLANLGLSCLFLLAF